MYLHKIEAMSVLLCIVCQDKAASLQKPGTFVIDNRLSSDCGTCIPVGARLLYDRVDALFYERDPDAAFVHLMDLMTADFKGSLKRRDPWHVLFEAHTVAKDDALVRKLMQIGQ